MSQDVKALEEALSKAGHCGKFSKASRCTVEAEETDEWPRVTVTVHANKIVGPKLAAYIAACSPDRIRRLLDYIRKLEQGCPDAARYRAFFDAGLPITFLGVDYHDKASLDAAIDAQLPKEPSNG